MNKVTIPREVAQAIEEVRAEEGRSWDGTYTINLLNREFIDVASFEWGSAETIKLYLDESFENVVTYYHAVKDGYSVDTKSPIVEALQQVKQQIEEATQFLGTLESQPMQEIYALDDALEHINQALERLGVTLDGGGEDK